MINAEFYKDEILDLINNGKEIALNKHTKKLMPCEPVPERDDEPCKDCLWENDVENPDSECCVLATMRWLLAEHKEYPKLTRYEKETLERMRDVEYSWIARNGYGYIDIFFYKPSKKGDYWVNGSNSSTMDIYDADFAFIQWTDEEPWSIQELLENCEVEE